jgi:hypothetical protein
LLFLFQIYKIEHNTKSRMYNNQDGRWLKMRADPQHQQNSCCKNIWFGKIVTRGAAGGKQTVAEAGILDVRNGAQVG